MNAAPELIPSALKMISALAIVLGGMFVVVHFARRYLRRAGAATHHRLVRVIASQAIGVKKNLLLVDVPDAVLVLGVSGDRIQMLSRIDDPETLSQVRGHVGPSGPRFQEHLARLIARRKADENEN
jgi:flagellar biosynthetic protein FliO